MREWMWRNSSTLWSEFCKTHYTQNRIFQTFQNYWNLDLLDFCMYQYDKYNSKNYAVVYMCMEVIICHSQMSPEILWYLRHIGWGDTSHGKRHMEETIPAFGVTFAKPFLLKIQYSKPSIIIEIWTLHISAFVNMTNIIVKSYTL